MEATVAIYQNATRFIWQFTLINAQLPLVSKLGQKLSPVPNKTARKSTA